VLPLEAPLDDYEGDGTDGSHDHQDAQLNVQSEVRGVEEADGRRHRLGELEQGEGAHGIVHILAAQHRVDLGVEAGIAQAQKKGTDQRNAGSGRIQVGYIGGIFERCAVRQVDESHEEGRHVHHIAGNHDGIASISRRLVAQYAKESSSEDLAGSNANAHQANDLLRGLSNFRGESNRRSKNATEE